MKKFLVAGVLSALLCALPMSAKADEKLDARKASAKIFATVTRDNFVSLNYESVGEFANLKTQIELQGNTLVLEEFPRFGGVGLFSGQEITAPRPTARLSNNQLDDVIWLANKIQLSSLAGKYRQPNLRDDLKETLTLTISDERNRDQKFVIENSGNKAPSGFFQIVAALRQLRLDKFPGTSENASTPDALVSRNNFQNLTFETSGGFAGMRAILELRVPLSNSKNGKIRLQWSQKIGGRETKYDTSLSSADEIALFRALNAADLPRLNGKNFRQPGLSDGFNEVIALTLNDGRKFTVSNYGDQAPPEYSALARFLNSLKNKASEQ